VYTWFFTTYSFSTIASLLNYSVVNPPLSIRLYGKDAEDRFLFLEREKTYSRSYTYHEIKRLASQKGIDWTLAIRAQDLVFANAWRNMQDALEEQHVIGEKRKYKLGSQEEMKTGYDALSEKKCVKLGQPRL
jgi:hypothetical protein